MMSILKIISTVAIIIVILVTGWTTYIRYQNNRSPH